MNFDYKDIEQLEKETQKRLYTKAKGAYVVKQPILNPEQIKKAAFASINYKSGNWQKYYDFALDYIELYTKDYYKLKKPDDETFYYFYVCGKIRFVNYGIENEDFISLIYDDIFLSSVLGITLERKKQVCNEITERRCTLYEDDVTDDAINKILDFCNKYIFIEQINEGKWVEIMIFGQPTPPPKTITVNLIEGGQREATIYYNKPQPVKVKKVKWLAYLFFELSERGIIIKKWQDLAGKHGLFASKKGTAITSNYFARALSDYRLRAGRKKLNDKRLQDNEEINLTISKFVKSL